MVDQLDTVKAKYEYVHIIRDLNKKQPVFRLPKHLFIKNVLVFLEDRDIINLSHSCKFFSIIIFNPFTLRMLLALRGMTRIPQQVSPVPNLAKQGPKGEEKNVNTSNTEDIMAQLETLKMVKEFMTEKVKMLEDSIRNNQKDLNQLKKDLFYERNQNFSSAEKILVLENKIKSFDMDKRDHGETIKELNMRYQKILMEKEGDFKLLEEENNKLQSEKEELVNEMIKVREDKDQSLTLNTNYKYALLKMKKLFSSNPIYRQAGQQQQQNPPGKEES